MKIAVAGATGQVGRQVVALARAQGHEVVELARSTGFDLLKPDGLTEALATAAVAKVLLAAALGEITGDVDLAGPKAERLADLIERLIQHRHLDLKVELMPAPESWTNGSMLPGPGALLRGPDWQTWL